MNRSRLLLCAAVLLSLGCSDSPTAPAGVEPYVYTVPEQTTDGWAVGAARDVGLNEARLAELIDIIRSGVYAKVHGVVIVKDGKLVLEEYFSGKSFEAAIGDSIVGQLTHFDRDTPHNLASVTKSVASTLLGIAIDQGLVTGVDTAVYDFFPEHASVRDPAKDLITLHDLLTMTSGLDWDETSYGYGDGRNDINALFSQTDPVRYILAKDAVDPPGTRWIYNGGGTNILGQVVKKASNLRLDTFANRHLFGPLGIDSPSWVFLRGPMTYASGDLKLKPRDMAKVGYLFVNDGMWGSQQIISPAWIDQATSSYSQTRDPRWGYGYQWWLYDFTVNGTTYPSFGARGWGGQVITMFPTIDLVVVLTGGNYLTSDPAEAIMQEFVLDAVVE